MSKRPSKMGRFEKRLFVTLLLLSVVPTLVTAVLGTRYLLSYLERVSSPVLRRSAENSLELARKLHTYLEARAEAASDDIALRIQGDPSMGRKELDELLKDTRRRHRVDFIAFCVMDSCWLVTAKDPELFQIDENWLSSFLTDTSYVRSPDTPHIVASFTKISDDSAFLAGFVLDPQTVEMIIRANDDLGRYSFLPLYLRSQGILLTIVVAITVTMLLVLSLVLSRMLARRISFPIEQLAIATNRIAKGDLDHRVMVEARDEIEDLVNAFNKMTEDLKKNKEDLIRAERLAAWRDIARRVAHEINNPLTPIQTTIYRLKHRFEPGDASNAEIIKMLDLISRKVEDLRNIATRFSELAKMPEPRIQALDLNQTIEETLGLLENISPNIEIVKEMAPNLPRVGADASQIRRLIENLVKNAIEALPEGGKVSVRTLKQEDSGFAIIEVADNGKGIPEEIRNRIFDPYFTTKPYGSGLGLAVVQKIVEDHKGRIEFETSGSGTVFRIYLPLLSDEEGAAIEKA